MDRKEGAVSLNFQGFLWPCPPRERIDSEKIKSSVGSFSRLFADRGSPEQAAISGVLRYGVGVDFGSVAWASPNSDSVSWYICENGCPQRS